MSWHIRAACRPGQPDRPVRPQDFSPVNSQGRVDLPAARAVAARYCHGCPVLARCHADALDARPIELVQAGIWWPTGQAVDPRPVPLLDNTDTSGADSADTTDTADPTEKAAA